MDCSRRVLAAGEVVAESDLLHLSSGGPKLQNKTEEGPRGWRPASRPNKIRFPNRESSAADSALLGAVSVLAPMNNQSAYMSGSSKAPTLAII